MNIHYRQLVKAHKNIQLKDDGNSKVLEKKWTVTSKD